MPDEISISEVGPDDGAAAAATAAQASSKPAAGATRAEWDAYAASSGLDPSGYGTKDELIAAVEAQG